MRLEPSSPAAFRARCKAARDLLLQPLVERHDRVLLAIGRSESRTIRSASLTNLREAEFRVFSQWGEDGIIQYLLSRVPIDEASFVELGVDDYRESNTRFLLENDSWRGLVVDAGAAHLTFLEQSGLRWRHRIDGRSVFLTTDNVNRVLIDGGFAGDLGLLSIDLDGNDYWILEATEAVSPRLLVLEYNSLFGPAHAVTVPYDPGFSRRQAHYSGLYFGASLRALCQLAGAKGYRFVGSGSSGVNAFFVRADVAGDLPEVSPEAGWVPSQHRDSRNRKGRLSYVDRPEDRLRLIREMPLVDLNAGATQTVGHLFGL